MPSRTLTLGQGSKMVMDNSYIVPETWTYHSSHSPFIPSPQQSSHQNYFNFSTNATSHYSAEIESSHSEPKVKTKIVYFKDIQNKKTQITR